VKSQKTEILDQSEIIQLQQDSLRLTKDRQRDLWERFLQKEKRLREVHSEKREWKREAEEWERKAEEWERKANIVPNALKRIGAKGPVINNWPPHKWTKAESMTERNAVRAIANAALRGNDAAGLQEDFENGLFDYDENNTWANHEFIQSYGEES